MFASKALTEFDVYRVPFLMIMLLGPSAQHFCCSTWTKRGGRMLDIVGDYAGQELFLLDGDALLQLVLDDPLLALGKDSGPSFQLLHAAWRVEKTLQEFISRDCTFEVVFFEVNTHVTILSGSAVRVTSSRGLARELLRRHILSLSIPTHTFESLQDPEWTMYFDVKRPMFFMTHDGGQPSSENKYSAERVLYQRFFLLSMINSGFPVALLHPAEFRDGKILTYVYEGRKSRPLILPQHLVDAFRTAQGCLSQATESTDPPYPPPASPTFQAVLTHALTELVSRRSSLGNAGNAMLWLYLCHAIVLTSLPLNFRAQNMPKLSHELTSYLNDDFLPLIYSSIRQSAASLPKTQGLCDIDLDGRLFCILVSSLLASPLPVGDIIGDELLAITTARALEIGLPPVDFASLRRRFPNQLPHPHLAVLENSQSTLLPYSNNTFDRHLESIRVDVSDFPASATTPNRLDFDTVFKDEIHWHSHNPLLPTHLGGNNAQPLSEWERRRRDRKEHRNMAAMQRSAASLTGALGTVLQQQIIPAVAKHPVTKHDGSFSRVQANRKTSAKALTSKERLLAENAARKEAEVASQNEKWWAEKISEIGTLSLQQQLPLVKAFAMSKRTSDKWLKCEILLKQMDIELRMWIADEKREVPEVADRYRIFLATTSRSILESSLKNGYNPNEKQRKAILSVLEALGFSCLAQAGSGTNTVEGSDYTTSKPKKSTPSKKAKPIIQAKPDARPTKGDPLFDFMKIKEDVYEYQLRVMGEWMTRSLDSQPDPRVDFEPDQWQRDVLDKIDANESMLIVAPTSSGKTFISFAAMEKVLRESDDGVVVYVAPTKALVNQVAAEVYARFRKSVPGVHMWAIHTRDYRINNPHNCQILVTVPHIFSIMLLSPALAAVWTPRLRRVIVDEVHSISEVEGGAVWEQVLLMNPAPLIGLSATVGDPLRFSSWLESVERNRGRQYSLILHKHRYNALRKFMYLPRVIRPVKGPLSEHGQDSSALVHVHPIAALALGDPNLPDDLALEPRDCLSLWQAMCWTGEPLNPNLTPSTFFASTPSIAIRDVIKYEAELKDVLILWSNRADYRAPTSPYQKVIKYLQQPLAQAATETQMQESMGAMLPELAEPDTRDSPPCIITQCMLSVLAELNAKDALPCIVFNFDRHKCERIACHVVFLLEKAEQEWRKTSPAWKNKITKWKEQQQIAALKLKNRAHTSRKEQENDARDEDSSIHGYFDPNEPSEQFSFVGKGTSQHDLNKELDEVAWAKSKIPDCKNSKISGSVSNPVVSGAVVALRRGIGVHHAGMNRAYRSLVETLFRKGALKVIVSTGTLALGINAPARTCVFAGDSVYLTALNFRQCSDSTDVHTQRSLSLGLVVFVGLELDRVQRLLLSRLPKLVGLILVRHQNRFESFITRNSEYAVNTINSLLTLPQLTVGNETRREQFLHFIRFSIDYLRRLGLLDPNGRPMNLYGVVSHLYPHEPANFALVALIRSGILHEITRDLDKSDVAHDQALSDLMTVLATLLATCTRRSQTNESLLETIRKSSSRIIMPPLPPGVLQVLKDHHASILGIFSSYVEEYCRQYATSLRADNILPLSQRVIGCNPTANLANTFIQRLESSRIYVKARSSFVALSGHEDSFSSVEELVESLRAGIVLPLHAVPSLTKLTNPNHQLDAYAYDFWHHGSLEVLARDNGIRRGDIWYMLEDFHLALSALKTALETLLVRAEEEGEAFQGNDKDDKDEDEDETDSSSNELISRPGNVDISDWRLYKAIAILHQDFGDKFRKIFA
ncbi:uncharacterized protein EI90DRAFT_3128818 [Cantharellus anzutake]|uniref:uncharacterized protein n=1 Tax=Cantharellus anzutake TaxID=1750568 RepID=UPI0019086080|nr:uncharacterized protein EI90DRAFT_3128818 [Cantharellus anzutake]KAF8325454.1 hypothetical protein EI90DRAFT_3128818 [Cantharellus anzutake]